MYMCVCMCVCVCGGGGGGGGWGMLVHHNFTLQHHDRQYPFICLGEERQCEVKFLV